MSIGKDKEYVTLWVSPWDLEVKSPKRENMMNALMRGGIYFKNACGGDANCARCKVEVYSHEHGEYQELLSCKTVVDYDISVRVSPEMVIND